MNTPITLDHFYYKKLNIEWIDGIVENNKSLFNIDFSFEIKTKNDDKNQTLLSLGINISPVENFQGLKISAIIDGFFTINSTTDDNERNYYSTVNAANILYGIFRGQISMISADFSHGKILLPTVMMHDEIEKFKKKNESTKSSNCKKIKQTKIIQK